MPLPAASPDRRRAPETLRLRLRSMPAVVAALRAAVAVRALVGLLTLFLAFLLRQQGGGNRAVVALVVAATLGSAAGTVLGARLQGPGARTCCSPSCWRRRPRATAAGALLFTPAVAVAVAASAAMAGSLAKLALDAVLQRDVPERDALVGVRPQRDRAAAGVGRAAAGSASSCRWSAASGSGWRAAGWRSRRCWPCWRCAGSAAARRRPAEAAPASPAQARIRHPPDNLAPEPAAPTCRGSVDHRSPMPARRPSSRGVAARRSPPAALALTALREADAVRHPRLRRHRGEERGGASTASTTRARQASDCRTERGRPAERLQLDSGGVDRHRRRQGPRRQRLDRQVNGQQHPARRTSTGCGPAAARRFDQTGRRCSCRSSRSRAATPRPPARRLDLHGRRPALTPGTTRPRSPVRGRGLVLRGRRGSGLELAGDGVHDARRSCGRPCGPGDCRLRRSRWIWDSSTFTMSSIIPCSCSGSRRARGDPGRRVEQPHGERLLAALALGDAELDPRAGLELVDARRAASPWARRRRRRRRGRRSRSPWPCRDHLTLPVGTADSSLADGQVGGRVARRGGPGPRHRGPPGYAAGARRTNGLPRAAGPATRG